MRAYSTDLRERILLALDGGMPKTAVTRTFRVGRSTVNRYFVQRRDTGGISAKPIPGRPPNIHPEQHPELVAQLNANPDAILAEHCQTWERTHGVRLSIAAMHQTIARIDWTRKKRR